MNKSILEYLEATAGKYPTEVAVDDGNVMYSWSELLETAQRIGSNFARYLYGYQNKPIAIMLEKSAWTLAAMFGAVYAGRFYVMIDPEQPEERVKQILSVLQPELIVTQECSGSLLVRLGYEKLIVYPEDLYQGAVHREMLAEIRENCSSEDILYGIFTSGSTGTPKCVVVNHQAVMDFIAHFVATFGFDQKECIGNQAPFDFDVSVKDIYTSMLTGAKLVLIPRQLFSTPSLLMDYVAEKSVTSLTWAVSALTLVSSLRGLDYRVPDSVHRVMFSGEEMPAKQLKLWQEALPKAQFVNLYGPTEITCNCSYYRINHPVCENEVLPIGTAFDGRSIFLMRTDGTRIGEAREIGEICVAGESVAMGYYHNTCETQKHFLYEVDASGKRRRFYKSGDLGYWGEDGLLYFSGRRDFQIKHMGHRIELEEIERAVNQIDGVERCCCLMDARRRWIVAYYQGAKKTEEIREQLKVYLPKYMIPQKLVPIAQIPLNKNGKMDRSYFRKMMEVA